MTNEERDLKTQQYEAALLLKKHQDKVKNKYDFLKNTSVKYFQSAYVKAQAEEICKYLKDISLTPFNAWYSELFNIISEGEFMYKYYLTFNEHGVIEPDIDRIETLVLPDPNPEDFPRSMQTFV